MKRLEKQFWWLDKKICFARDNAVLPIENGPFKIASDFFNLNHFCRFYAFGDQKKGAATLNIAIVETIILAKVNKKSKEGTGFVYILSS